MTKLLKVLALLVVILGLGISCASAADVTLSFNPQTVELQPGSSQTVQIVMNQIPANGLSGFNITVSVADPTIANITAVSAPAWGGLIGTSTVPANSVWITAVDTTGKVHAGDTNVSFGSITITGIKGGKTNLTIVPKEIDDLPGNFIIPDVSTCQVIVLPPQPVAGFTEDVKSGVAPLKVHFTDKSQYATTVNWDFNGDGINDKSDAPGDQDYTYTTPGTYTVKQTVINTNGTASATDNITVIKPSTPVKADFKFVATNLEVQFTDNSTGSPNNWTWDFGDNTFNSTQSPSHTYANAGTYPVKLSVKNAEGSTDSITKDVTVIPPIPPKAAVVSFNPQTVELSQGSSQNIQIVMNQVPANGLSGFNITVYVSDPTIANITAVSAPAWGGLIGTSTVPANSVWITAVDTTGKVHAGDTNVSFGNISITGIKEGKTNLTIVPTEIDDLSGGLINPDVTMCQVKVLPIPQPVLPIAGFTEDVKSGVAPLKVHFTDKSQYATTVNWDFNGDGVVDKSGAPGDQDYTYTTLGTYTVKQTVINDNGTDFETDNISVMSIPPVVKADFKFVATNLAVQFTDNSTGSPNNWTWDFGDNAFNSTQSPSHTYASAGTYHVKLSVKNAEGSTDSITKNVTVTAPIPPSSLKINDFKADITSGYEPLKVHFTSDVSGSPTKWTWKFERSATQSFKVGTATHTFEHSGTYDITLTVRDAAGHIDTLTKKAFITVLKVKPPRANFVGTPTSGKVPLTVKFTDMSKNNPDHWKWDFGDGKKSTLQNPSHTYTKAGKYTVTLSVRNYAGSDTKKVYHYIVVVSGHRH